MYLVSPLSGYLNGFVFVKADINSPPGSLTYEASPLAVVTTATM